MKKRPISPFSVVADTGKHYGVREDLLIASPKNQQRPETTKWAVFDGVRPPEKRQIERVGYLLLPPQRDHGVEPSGPSGWEVAGYYSDSQEYGGDGHIRNRIGGTGIEEQTSNDPANG